MPKLQHPSFNSHWFDQLGPSKGETPTASQEALQDPTIDPVFLAAGGLVGGEENMMGRIIDEKSWQSSLHPSPSLTQNIVNFLKGMGSNIGSGATTQALLSDHKNVGKVGGLPAGQAVTNDANDLLLWGRMAAKSMGDTNVINDKFGRPIFDEQGKMVPWSESERMPIGKATSKIEWTKVGDMLKKLMGDVGEVE
jgi:hypothetical protein